ncbi:MAG TPA: hypothetical protein VFZ38_21320, partial [Vicinamibacterales bacterium]
IDQRMSDSSSTTNTRRGFFSAARIGISRCDDGGFHQFPARNWRDGDGSLGHDYVEIKNRATAASAAVVSIAER